MIILLYSKKDKAVRSETKELKSAYVPKCSGSYNLVKTGTEIIGNI
jgi:hypothetical protein